MAQRRDGPLLTRTGRQKPEPQRTGCQLFKAQFKGNVLREDIPPSPSPPCCLTIERSACQKEGGASSAEEEGQVKSGGHVAGMDSETLAGFLKGLKGLL